MKISNALRNRQRRLGVASRLPPFLRSSGCPISLTTSTSFPRDAADLLDIDGWSDECNCTLKGVLFLWRVFMALLRYAKFPDGTASLYDPEYEDDILLADPKFWVHESKIQSCESCLTRLKFLLEALRDHFLPPDTLVHWGRHMVRVAFFSDFTHAWVLENGPKIFEMGAMYHAALISFILSPNRAIDCALKESSGSDLALAKTEPMFRRLRDVLGGLLEGGFSLTFSSCGQPKSQLLIHRIDSHFGDLDPLGSIRFGTLSDWGVGDKRKLPVRQHHQRRLPPYVKKSKFSKQPKFFYRFGQRIPFHFPCLTVQSSTSGSMPGRLSNCCFYAIRNSNFTRSRNQIQPLAQGRRFPASPSSGPSAASTSRVPRRRPAPSRSFKSPASTSSTCRAFAPAPRRPVVAASLRFLMPCGLQSSSAGNLPPVVRPGPAEAERWERRRLFSVLSTDSSEEGEEAALQAVRNLFREW